MKYYFFVLLSSLLFALQFLFQQKFEEKSGAGLVQAISFSLYKGLTIVIMMGILSGFQFEFAWLSFWLSGVYALCYIFMAYFSLKAFTVANLSVYSVFTMLGGMLLPFVIGVLCYGEELTFIKVICCLLVIISVLLTIQKGASSKTAFLYYMLVFLLNGSIAVISKVHESAVLAHTGPQGFMLYSGIWTIVVCAIWLRITGEKIPVWKGEKLLYSVGNGFFNGIGDWLLLIAIANLDASVQYPLVTGAVMVFSTMISVIRHEKVRKMEYIVAGIAFVASVMMAF